MRGVGTFCVRRGATLAARLLARLMRLPRAGARVPVRLVVTRAGRVERWHRTFAGRDFITYQRRTSEGLLAERAGLFELLFSLEERGGVRRYRQVGFALRLGRLRAGLPRRLWPLVSARERVSADGTRLRASVRVSVPLVGLLLAYGGSVELEREGL
jgi:Domain of unknown function (DUF4166)